MDCSLNPYIYGLIVDLHGLFLELQGLIVYLGPNGYPYVLIKDICGLIILDLQHMISYI
jgi:hypothetical protein